MLVRRTQSCKGIRVESADVLPRGLRYDREFVIVEESTHRFLTARTIPKVSRSSRRSLSPGLYPNRRHLQMILIETAIDFETEILSITIPATDSAPSSTHTIPLARPNPSSFDGEVLNDVSIWIHRGLDGYSVGSDALRADLSAYMGREVLLVQKGEDLRSVKPDHVLRLPNAQFEYEDEPQVSWADEYPVLIVSRTSLAELDRRIKTDTGLHTAQAKRFNTERWLSSGKGIEVVRFRGNVVLDGVAKPWDEDSWGEIVVGDDKTSLLVAQRCARCQVRSGGAHDLSGRQTCADVSLSLSAAKR